MTNNAFFDFYKCNQQNTMSANTTYTRCNLLKNHFLPVFGDHQLSDIRADDITYLYEVAEQSGLSTNSMFGLYAALLSYFKDAVEFDCISENPVSIAPAMHPDLGRS